MPAPAISWKGSSGRSSKRWRRSIVCHRTCVPPSSTTWDWCRRCGHWRGRATPCRSASMSRASVTGCRRRSRPPSTGSRRRPSPTPRSTRGPRASTSTCAVARARRCNCVSAITGSASIPGGSPSRSRAGAPGWACSGCASGRPCSTAPWRFALRPPTARKWSPCSHWPAMMLTERRPIRVMLVDDHNLVRAGIRAVIDGQSDIQVIAEATEGREAIHLARGNCPDVAVIDVAMPGMSGIEVTRELRRLCPHVQVLILTAHDNEEYFFQTLKAGAVGYVLKKAAASDLIAAIEAASRGEPYLYPSVARMLVSDYLQRAPERDSFEPLSDRERIMKKLRMHDRTELVKYAIRKGLIEADS